MSSLAPGSTVCEGRYRLERIIGHGGMAVVWLATDVQLERQVAIKVISDVLALDPAFVKRFEREARISAGLIHPSLVKVFDFSAEGERPLLIMEYLPGGTLAERGSPIPPLDLARDLLAGLGHIHSAGIVHRDVKPANVLIGADNRPRLTDFGIARGEEATGLTATGQVMGTLRYLAPEVAEGGPATPQSDLYALGVVLADVAGDGPSSLGALIGRMRDPDPGRRPGSADEALTMLEPTDPTRVLPETAPRPRRRPPRVQPVHAILGAALAGLIAVVVALSMSGDDKPPRSEPVAQPAARGTPLAGQLDRLDEMVREAAAR